MVWHNRGDTLPTFFVGTNNSLSELQGLSGTFELSRDWRYYRSNWPL